MATKTINPFFKNTLLAATFITLIISPYISKDSMIIPKQILLFLLGMYLIPGLIFNGKKIIQIPKLKLLTIFVTLMVIQIFVSFFSSNAPLEQQIYGRTGRGTGVLTYIALLIILLSSAIFMQLSRTTIIIKFLAFSGLVTSVYSIFQSYGLDFLTWDSKTNGVIGTLGNPNFQASFAALVFIPGIFSLWHTKLRYLSIVVSSVIFPIAISRTQSTQGYVTIILAITLFSILYLWYKNRVVAIFCIIFTFAMGVVAIFGMLSHGPLSQFLYKVSVQSRGDFWRSAISLSKEYPITGVGIDSFGDYYLLYRDSIAANHPWAEYTDSAHNIFLDLTVSAGYPMSLLYLAIMLLVLVSFITTQKKIAKFNLEFSILFVAWLVYQAQSIISPSSIPMLLWNAILSGSIIGYSVLVDLSKDQVIPYSKSQSITKPFSGLLLIIGLIITYPLFETDRLQMKAMTNGDGDLAIVSAQKFPESVLRYTIISRELLNSNLPVPALVVAKSAVEFNPHSPNLWSLILINPAASIEDRLFAKNQVLKLDPLNKEVANYEIP